MKMLCKLTCFLYVLFIHETVTAQKTPKVTMEEIEKQCAGTDFAKRVRVSVSSFKVSTPKANGQFGDELSQMLSNALQNVNCFNVLLSLKDSKDLTDEIDFGKSGNTAAGSGPQQGKMKGAQVIVLGRVTEFAEGESSGGALGIKVGGNKAHVGFIIQLVNAETREVIESKSINVDGRANGFKGVKLFGVKMAGSTVNAAVADACEKGIIQAIEFIAANKDKMPLPDASNAPDVSGKGEAITLISVAKTDYAKLKVLADALGTQGKVLEKSISNGTGTIRFSHAASVDLAEYIDKKLGTKFSIVDFSNGSMKLEAK